MQLTVTSTSTDTVFPLTVPDDLEIENLKAFCEAESGIPIAEMALFHNGQLLKDDKKTVAEAGLKEGEMIILERKRKRTSSKPPAASAIPGGLQLPDFSQLVVPGGAAAAGGASSSKPQRPREDDPKFLRDMLMSNPEQLAYLRHNNPRLAEAAESGNMEEFSKILKEQKDAKENQDRMRMRLLTADPFDMEAQRLIAQEIEMKNIDQNMELAMEHSPESFGSVIMLYIDCIVNGHHIKAFVDSGAQTTIMSSKAAERCGIQRLVDKRWSGIAKGVGTQKIIGRVHLAQIQIGDIFLSSSFSILEEQPMDMLLGLDMLKRHQCCIDLKRNVLVIGSANTETRFLNESELPECARLTSKGLEDAIKESSKDSDKQLEEALKRSVEEQNKKLKTDDGASTSAAASASASSNVDLAIGPNDKFTEENVKTLMGYGFPRDKCISELRAANGDMTVATAALFAKSLKF